MKKLVNSLKPKRKAQNGPSSSLESTPVYGRKVEVGQDALVRQESVTRPIAAETKSDGEPGSYVFDEQESTNPARPAKATIDKETGSEHGTTLVQEDEQSAHSGARVNTTTLETSNKHEPSSRIEIRQQSLVEASNSLLEILKTYIDSPEAGEDANVLAELIAIDAESLDVSGPVTAEQLSRAVEAVLLKQQGQKPSLASKAGSAIGKLFPLASLVLGVGANVAEGASFTPVKVAANGLCLLLSIADQELAKGADFTRQLDRILYQSLRVAEFEKHPAIEIGDLLLEKSIALMTSIIVFFKDAIIFFRHNIFYHYGKAVIFGPKLYSDAKQQLDTAINEFDQALLLEVTLKVLSITNLPLAEALDSQPRKADLISWLKSSHWKADAVFAESCANRAPKTLEWVFLDEQLRNWRLSDEKSPRARSLWLTGLPGVGKSTIAAYIIQVLQAQHPDAAVLHFFVKAGDPSLSSMIQLIRTLAAQLAIAIPAAQAKLQSLKDEGFDSESTQHLFQKLIVNSLSGVIKEVFLVIDGWDEFESTVTDRSQFDNTAESLLEGIRKLDVKLVLSSRPTPAISRAMQNSETRTITYEDSRDDIRSFVNLRVSKSINLEKGFQSLGKDPGEFLAEKSQGNFLWVNIVLNILKDKPSVKGFREVIDTIPKEVEDVYDQVLDRIESRGQLETALSILKYVLYSFRVLTIPELESAVTLLSCKVICLKDFVETNCGSFLRLLPGENTGLYIAHETFRSYLTSPSSLNARCLLPAGSHAQITSACLDCLLHPENADLHAFREYATRQWLEHFADLLDNADEVSDSEILNVLQNLHAIFTSEALLRNWILRFVALECQDGNGWRIGLHIANIHTIIFAFFNVDKITRLESHQSTHHNDQAQAREPFIWAKSVKAGGNELARALSTNFTFVWLNTNWKTVETAEQLLRGTLTAARLLGQSPFKEESAVIRPKNRTIKETQSERRRGWHFYSSQGDYVYRGSIEEFQTLASSVGFNQQIGVQVGNFAFAELASHSSHCIKSFQSAIDEYPECWHLHEGLGNYYKEQGQRENAIRCYYEAIRLDPNSPKSAAFDYWKLVASSKEESGDRDGALGALRTGAHEAPDSEAYRYWDAMAQIYEKTGDGNSMVSVYQEAVKKHPRVSKDFWMKMAEVCGRGGAKQQEYVFYRDAMKEDPENKSEYGEKIRKLSKELKDLCIWQPAIHVLKTGAIEDPVDASKYQKELGHLYMCRRLWKEAIEQFEGYYQTTNKDDILIDIGDAYLGLGNNSKALAAYQIGAKEDPTFWSLSRTVGYVHILDGQYAQAIRLFKSALREFAEDPDKWTSHGFMQKVDDVKPLRLFELHRNLAACYEATGRPDDMQASLEAALEAYRPTLLQIDEDKDREIIYRHEARGFFETGLLYEKLGRKDDAKEDLSRAVTLFEKTTMEGDDETQRSEENEAVEALARVSQLAQDTLVQIPALKESVGCMRLQRRIALKYTTDWYVYQDWVPPRRRGARAWNEVSFVNKFKICNGDRTFIAPWGPGHHD